MKEVISAAEAARMIGCTPQMVRERIRIGEWTFGRRVPKEKTGRKCDSYEIYVRKLCKKFEIPLPENRGVR